MTTQSMTGQDQPPWGPDPVSAGPTVVRTYRAKNQSIAALVFQRDANMMAEHGYFPVAQSWAPGQRGAGAYLLGILLIFLFGLGLLILGYLLIVKPEGTLTVTYNLRTATA